MLRARACVRAAVPVYASPPSDPVHATRAFGYLFACHEILVTAAVVCVQKLVSKFLVFWQIHIAWARACVPRGCVWGGCDGGGGGGAVRWRAMVAADEERRIGTHQSLPMLPLPATATMPHHHHPGMP